MNSKALMNSGLKTGIAAAILSFYACSQEETLYEQNIYTENIEVSMYENPEVGTVLATINSVDTDAAADPTFSISSQSVAGLSIDGNQLIVSDPSLFDYETSPVITGEIKASLSQGEYTSSFTINLLNLIEADEAFVTTWETTSASEAITIYTHASEEDEVYYDFDVDWGDGTTSEGLTDDTSHTYETAGTYTVSITGKLFPGITQEDATNAAKLKTVEAWGGNEWTNLSSGFAHATDLVINATDIPMFGEGANLGSLFMNATNFNSDIGHWDMHNVAGINNLFRSAPNFNQDISGWDTSTIETMHAVFLGASSFNQPIGAWDISNVEDISAMFSAANAFNQDLSGWDTSSLQNAKYTFNGAKAFNQDISGWDTSSLINCIHMFNDAEAFDQPIGTWDMSNVVDITGMFANTEVFNQDLSAWDVSAVTNMTSLFQVAKAFNQDISGWDVSNVTSMNSTFYNATAFNQPLNAWDTVKVTNMYRTFRGASVFDQSLSTWNTASVTDMREMFRFASVFNQDLTSWDVSNVTTYTNIFNAASAFDAANTPNWVN